jgi:hypothetical protein
MKEQNQQRGSNRYDQAGSELDSVLDAALGKYAAVEPRAGLEERVLASLRAERTRVADRGWWRWRWAGALATVVAVAVALAWKSGKQSPPIVAKSTSVTMQSPVGLGTHVASGDGDAPRLQGHSVRYAARHPLRAQSAAAAIPRLDVFPSPQPLSEQEKIMASYVAEYPEHAALIARARMDAIRRDVEERKAISSDSGPQL